MVSFNPGCPNINITVCYHVTPYDEFYDTTNDQIYFGTDDMWFQKFSIANKIIIDGIETTFKYSLCSNDKWDIGKQWWVCLNMGHEGGDRITPEMPIAFQTVTDLENIRFDLTFTIK